MTAYYGINGNDILYRKAGNNTLDGTSRNDDANRGDSDDTIFNGPDNNMLYREAGNDTLYGSDGGNYLNVGSGVAAASYVSADSFVIADFAASTACGDDDTLTRIEKITGLSFNDTLSGDA